MHPAPRILICLIFNITLLSILAVLRTEYDHISGNTNQYDYIVIGSATGGVIATRLSEQRKRVLLIEAGPNDKTYSCHNCNAYPYGDLHNGTINIPYKGWWFKNVRDLNWNSVSAPSFWNYNKTILHRKESVSRARMLGGCLSHNGHAWMRGDIRDYDFVSQENNLPDWSFNNVQTYFQKVETYLGENKSFRGSDGPIEIRHTPPQPMEFKLKAFFDTAINYGLPYNNYQNGIGSPYGIAIGEANIGKFKNGKHGLFNTTYYRESSSQSYVRNIGMKNGFLTVWSNTTVQSIVFDTNDIPNAAGVKYWDSKDGVLKTVYCNSEVIVSAGLHQSPQILMLSGIGSLKQLNKFNITPIAHVRAHEFIGKNGQDHTVFKNFRYRVKEKMLDYNIHLKGPKPILINKYFGKEKEENKYVSLSPTLRGRIELVLSSNKYHRLGSDYNDIRVSCWDGLGNRIVNCVIDTAIYSKNLTIELNSNDSRNYPIVYNNYFSDSRDYDVMIEGIHKLREIFQFNKNVFVKELYPGIDKTDQQLRDIIFNDASSSIHGVGTCSMGHNNNIYSNKYPLTSKCSVRGVDKLRVADASIWPYSPHGGTQALVFMIGEKCAQHIIDDMFTDTNVSNTQYMNHVILYFGMIFLFFIVGYQLIYEYKLYNGKRKYVENILLSISILIFNWFLIRRLIE